MSKKKIKVPVKKSLKKKEVVKVVKEVFTAPFIDVKTCDRCGKIMTLVKSDANGKQYRCVCGKNLTC